MEKGFLSFPFHMLLITGVDSNPADGLRIPGKGGRGIEVFL